jgi:hypothetical protein
MNKGHAISTLRKCGDGIVEFKDGTEPAAVTLFFNNKYIKQKRNFVHKKIEKDEILVFDWTNNEFNTISARSIKKIIPLASILNNIREENGKTI